MTRRGRRRLRRQIKAGQELWKKLLSRQHASTDLRHVRYERRTNEIDNQTCAWLRAYGRLERGVLRKQQTRRAWMVFAATHRDQKNLSAYYDARAIADSDLGPL